MKEQASGCWVSGSRRDQQGQTWSWAEWRGEQCDRARQRIQGPEHRVLREGRDWGPRLERRPVSLLYTLTSDSAHLGMRLPEKPEMPPAQLFSTTLYILGHIPPVNTSPLTLLLFLLFRHKNLQIQVLFKVNEGINSWFLTGQQEREFCNGRCGPTFLPCGDLADVHICPGKRGLCWGRKKGKLQGAPGPILGTLVQVGGPGGISVICSWLGAGLLVCLLG